MDLAGYLDSQLRAAGIPIVGVSVKDATDRSTWLIQYAANATAEHRAAAEAIVAQLATDAGTIGDADLQARLVADKLYRATVIWMAGKVGVTPTQARTEIVAIYKAL